MKWKVLEKSPDLIYPEDKKIKNGRESLAADVLEKVPVFFDEHTIRQQLETYKNNESALSVFVEGLKAIFKHAEQLKAIDRMLSLMGKAEELYNKQYEVIKAKGKLELVDLELEVKRAELMRDKTQYEVETAELREKGSDGEREKEQKPKQLTEAEKAKAEWKTEQEILEVDTEEQIKSDYIRETALDRAKESMLEEVRQRILGDTPLEKAPVEKIEEFMAERKRIEQHIEGKKRRKE